MLSGTTPSSYRLFDFVHEVIGSCRLAAELSDGLSPGGRASPFFCGDILQHRVVEHRLGQKLLQLDVLIFQRLQALGVRDIEAAILGLPLVKRRAADPVLATHVSRLRPGFMLAQNPDDLFFRERLGFMYATFSDTGAV